MFSFLSEGITDLYNSIQEVANEVANEVAKEDVNTHLDNASTLVFCMWPFLSLFTVQHF